MQVSLTSKNILLTDGLQAFIFSKLQKFSKFSSRGLSRIQVVLNIDRRKKGDTQDAVVELIGDMGGKPITVRDQGATFYQAFFGAITKMKSRLAKEKAKQYS
ncbi:MAG: ribosome-associated translation inhibitor RaiA [Candidatus Woesebacteria bacterium]